MNLRRKTDISNISDAKYMNIYCITREGRSVTPAGNKLLFDLITAKKKPEKEMKVNSGAMLNNRKYLAAQLKLPDDVIAISYKDASDGVSKVSVFMDATDVASIKKSLEQEEGTSWEIIRKKM